MRASGHLSAHASYRLLGQIPLLPNDVATQPECRQQQAGCDPTAHADLLLRHEAMFAHHQTELLDLAANRDQHRRRIAPISPAVSPVRHSVVSVESHAPT